MGFRSGPGRRPRIRCASETMAFLAAEVTARDLNLCDVEAEAGLSKGTVSRWLRNIHEPKFGSVQAVMNLLGYELVPRRINRHAPRSKAS